MERAIKNRSERVQEEKEKYGFDAALVTDPNLLLETDFIKDQISPEAAKKALEGK